MSSFEQGGVVDWGNYSVGRYLPDRGKPISRRRRIIVLSFSLEVFRVAFPRLRCRDLPFWDERARRGVAEADYVIPESLALDEMPTRSRSRIDNSKN